VQRGVSLAVLNLNTGAATFLLSSSSFILTRAVWTPFQTHRYSENLVAPRIEPLDHRGGGMTESLAKYIASNTLLLLLLFEVRGSTLS
jgi:hypothetical protein